MKPPNDFTFGPNLLVHNIWLPDIQASSAFSKMATGQQDKVDGTSSEKSTLYPVMEEEISEKQEVDKENPKVDPEHSN